jgi:acetyltransferase-like isoleucine patch superfamily enzyme
MESGTHAALEKLAACGAGTTLHPSVVVVEPASVRLGSDVTVEPLAVLMGSPEGHLEVGDGSLVGPHAYLLLPGVRLGEGVQVGAGAVVRGSHDAGGVIAGVPARFLRMRGEGDWAAGLTD